MKQDGTVGLGKALIPRPASHMQRATVLAYTSARPESLKRSGTTEY